MSGFLLSHLMNQNFRLVELKSALFASIIMILSEFGPRAPDYDMNQAR